MNAVNASTSEVDPAAAAPDGGADAPVQSVRPASTPSNGTRDGELLLQDTRVPPPPRSSSSSEALPQQYADQPRYYVEPQQPQYHPQQPHYVAPNHYGAPPYGAPYYNAPIPQQYGYYDGSGASVVLQPLAPPGAERGRPQRSRYLQLNPSRLVPENVERVAMCFKRTAASQPHAIDATLTRRPHRCGWRNCRRSHPRRCSRGPCAICGEGSHATRFHTDFEAYIAAQRPRPPMEPEGEDVEAMMRGLGMRGTPPARTRALPPDAFQEPPVVYHDPGII